MYYIYNDDNEFVLETTDWEFACDHAIILGGAVVDGTTGELVMCSEDFSPCALVIDPDEDVFLQIEDISEEDLEFYAPELEGWDE